jgi:hypothetical protein
MQHPSSTGTRGTSADQLPDWLKHEVAKSERRQAALARFTPAQARAHAAYYRRRHKHELRLTAAKRARGYVDCSREFAIASRLALRPRERRDHGAGTTTPATTTRTTFLRTARSSRRSSSTSRDDGEPPPPPPHWRRCQPAAWRTHTPEPRRTRRSRRVCQAVQA